MADYPQTTGPDPFAPVPTPQTVVVNGQIVDLDALPHGHASQTIDALTGKIVPAQPGLVVETIPGALAQGRRASESPAPAWNPDVATLLPHAPLPGSVPLVGAPPAAPTLPPATEVAPVSTGAPAAIPPAPVSAHGGGGPSSRVGSGNVSDVDAISRASNDVQTAMGDVGDAQAAHDQAEADARAHGREQMDLQREKLQETQRLRDENVRRINEDQQRAYDEAHKATIPDFWDGRFGQHVVAAVSMALGEAGRALIAFGTGANVGNTAKDIIDRNVAQYYQRKKEEVDNLFKYAAAKNQLGEQEKAQWAAKLNDLQFEMAATHQSIADHIMEVGAATKGRIDQTQAAVLAKQQAEQAVQHQNKARQDNFDNQVSLKRLGIEAFNASTARMNALEGKQARLDQKGVEQIARETKMDETRLNGSAKSPGLISSWQNVRELANNYRQAAASGDPQQLIAATIAAREQISRINTGAVPSHEVLKLQQLLQGDPATVQERVSKFFGKPAIARQAAEGLIKELDQADDGYLHKIDQEQARFNAKYHSQTNGLAQTDAQKRHVRGVGEGLFSQITTRTPQGEVPRYAGVGGGTVPATPAAPAPSAPSVPAGTRATSGGKPIVMTDHGWELAK